MKPEEIPPTENPFEPPEFTAGSPTETTSAGISSWRILLCVFLLPAVLPLLTLIIIVQTDSLDRLARKIGSDGLSLLMWTPIALMFVGLLYGVGLGFYFSKLYGGKAPVWLGSWVQGIFQPIWWFSLFFGGCFCSLTIAT